MTWITLGNPTPRTELKSYRPFIWPVGEINYLSAPTNLPNQPFCEVISARRTRRAFGQVDNKELATLLWLTCRGQEWGDTTLGFPLTKRPAPSAGAIHPIHVLVNTSGDNRWWRYIADDHALADINAGMLDANEIRRALEDVLAPSQGTIILFVAEPGKTFAKYDDGCSLVWRDAGVLLGCMALTAESLNLNFCPLGITGEPWASQLDQQGSLIGVGMALLGSSGGG
jgi:SagB-type dehydrogenase family enzyme